MKKIINSCLLAVALFLAACSEDVNPNPELAGPLYGLQKGEPGSVDELIYNTWEHCGVHYIYDYEYYAFQVTNWSGYFNKYYTPVKEENKEVIRKVVTNIQEGVFAGMDADFIRRNWFVRVFLCDTLCDGYAYDEDDVVDTYMENQDMLIIPNVGEKMQNFTDEDWAKWQTEFSNLLISRLYLGASEQPTAFFDLRFKNANGKEATYFLTTVWVEDPEHRYSKNVYTFRTKGYIKSKPSSFQVETINVVDKQKDVADYINFLTTTTKEELDHNWSRFPLLLQRAKALIPYLGDVLGLDITAMQNANCPDDPVSADYFKNL